MADTVLPGALVEGVPYGSGIKLVDKLLCEAVLMQSHLKLIAIGVGISLSSCLINEPFVRTYNIDVSEISISVSDIESFFTEYFLGKGLSVKRKYSVLYPAKSHYILYEIRSRSENNMYGYPTITLLINEDGDVYLQQEEWTLQPVQPMPTDYIAELRDDLEKKWMAIHKRALQIKIVDTVDPYRGFSHDN